MIEFSTMVSTIDRDKNKSLFTRIKTVDTKYPLYGKVDYEPAGAFDRMHNEPNTLLINESLSKNLNLKIDDKIKVQNQLFTIIGIVKSVPDVSGFVAFGDWALAGPGVIQAAVSKMTNGEKYVCIARTVEKGIGRFGQAKSILSIGLGCEAKYAKDFVYTENVNINDKSTEIPIGVSCRTCDRLDCSQRAFPPLHKKFDIDINTRGVSVYVTDENS